MAENNNNLTQEQNALVETIFSLMVEAKALGVGFIFDKTTYQMSAINAVSMKDIMVEDVSDNCNLNDANMNNCQVSFNAHYYSDGEFLVAR